MAGENPTPGRAAGTRPSKSFWWALAAIAFAAYVVRALVVVVVDPSVPRLGDASAYHLLARHLAEGFGYIRPFDLPEFGRIVPTAEYPPLHPFLLSIFVRLGLNTVEAQRLALSILGSGTVVLIGTLGRKVAGDATGLVAAGLAAISPMVFLPETTLMSETLFLFLVTAALLLALRVYEAPRPARIIGLGIVLGLAALSRGEALVLGVLLLAPCARPGVGSWRRRAAAILTGLVVMAAVVLPWTIRNQRTFDRLVPISNNVGTALAGANCDLTYEGASLGSWRSTFGADDADAGKCFTGFNGRRPGFNEADAAAAARRQGLTYAREHPGRLPLVASTRVLRTFGLFRPAQQIELEALEGRPQRLEQLGTWFEWALYPLAIGGAVVLVRRRAPIWPLAASVITVIVSTLLTYGNQRFRIAAEPAILIAAATAMVTLGSRRRVASTAGAEAPGTPPVE